jgi:hypothetical protein
MAQIKAEVDRQRTEIQEVFKTAQAFAPPAAPPPVPMPQAPIMPSGMMPPGMQ